MKSSGRGAPEAAWRAGPALSESGGCGWEPGALPKVPVVSPLCHRIPRGAVGGVPAPRPPHRSLPSLLVIVTLYKTCMSGPRTCRRDAFDGRWERGKLGPCCGPGHAFAPRTL